MHASHDTNTRHLKPEIIVKSPIFTISALLIETISQPEDKNVM